MGKAVFRGEQVGKTKRHDYRAGEKFNMKAKKVKSKVKVSVWNVRPIVVNVTTGSIYAFSRWSGEEITEPVIMGYDRNPKIYKKGNRNPKIYKKGRGVV
jgi:hypothetical protein